MAIDWISRATSKNKGVFKRQAEQAGMNTSTFAKKNENKPGTTGRRARLAETLMGFNKKSK